MIDLSSPEYQKLFQGSAKGQKLNSVLMLLCSAETCLATVLSFYKNKTVILIVACIAIALLAVLIVCDVYYLLKYTVKIKGVLARWTADIAESSGIFDGERRLELTLGSERFSMILLRGDGKKATFNLEPVKTYPNIEYVAFELICKYVEARLFSEAKRGKPYESAVLHYENGKKNKTRIFVQNGVLIKNKGEKNYFLKHGLIV
ncbi:MAG: hypothetical protein ACI4L9_02385 [Candidatus Coproplasma sp.]